MSMYREFLSDLLGVSIKSSIYIGEREGETVTEYSCIYSLLVVTEGWPVLRGPYDIVYSLL